MKKWIYELIYCFPFVPIDWVFGSSSGIENLVDPATNGWIESGRAVTLGLIWQMVRLFLVQQLRID